MNKVYLALDLGDVRIGVAKSDSLGMFANAYEVIDRNKIDPFNRISEIIKEEKVKALVVGKPITKDGIEARQVEKVNLFIEELKKSLDENFPIFFIDERYSSKSAEYYLKNFSKKNGKERRKIVDMVAAQIILQVFLDKYKNKL